MSPALFALGRVCFRHRRRVVIVWFVLILLLGGLTAAFGKGTSEVYSVPGSESQETLDDLNGRFPEIAGSSGQIVVLVEPGERVGAAGPKGAIQHAVEALRDVPGVAAVTDPFAENISGAVSADHRAAVVTVQFEGDAQAVTSQTKDAIQAEASALRDQGLTAAVGGQVFGNAAPTMSWIESLGLVLALAVLLAFFRNWRAAAAPLVTAVFASAVTGLALLLATAVVALTGTAPMLALMLCTAVGIDYSLFLLSRYVENLNDGIDGAESAARATATAGSAVVFAGFTVITALTGLVIVGLPFLSAMGVSAAFGVAVAVAAALTLGPALMGYLERALRPSPVSTPGGALDDTSGGAPDDTAAPDPHPHHGRHEAARRSAWQHRWITAVTRWPALTVLVVTAALAMSAVPAKDLRLALPDNGTAPAGASERVAYDLIAEHFGPGENGPLLIVADILQSTDPVGVMDDLRSEVERVPGIERVTLATPNRKADTGVIVAIPATAPGDPATADLVQRLRDEAPRLGAKHDVTLRVAGQTAAQIDVSTRLQDALLPFGTVVIGLSLLLLLVVFRSFVVPLTAAAGFLLSVGSAFGVITAVFEWGWLADVLHVARVGPVISFMPVILMGVLFGLAMDYQMFIVSRMHEHYAHGGDARAAVRQGFLTSAGVVAAAAIIMVGVFAAFVPEGDASLKPIALGLAVGVFVDAFIVRMMLVPAALQLAGDAAWALPESLRRRLPHLDVEGHGVAHQIAAEETIAAHPDRVVHARGLRVSGPRGDVFTDLDLDVRAGTLCAITADEGGGKTAALLALAGRLRPSGGELDVAGAVVPEQRALVQRRVGLGEFASINAMDGDLDIRQHIAERLATRTIVPWARRRDVDEVIATLDQACDIAARTIVSEANPGATASHPEPDTHTVLGAGTIVPDAQHEPDAQQPVLRPDPIFVDPGTPVQDLSRLQRQILALVLAGIGQPALLVVDDADQLSLPEERAGLWAVLGWLARTGTRPAVVVACRRAPGVEDLARLTGLDRDDIQTVPLRSAAPVPVLAR